MKEPTEPLAVSITATCQLIGVKRTKVYALVSEGLLEPCRIGRRTLVTRRSIDALIERGVAEAKQVWTR